MMVHCFSKCSFCTLEQIWTQLWKHDSTRLQLAQCESPVWHIFKSSCGRQLDYKTNPGSSLGMMMTLLLITIKHSLFNNHMNLMWDLCARVQKKGKSGIKEAHPRRSCPAAGVSLCVYRPLPSCDSLKRSLFSWYMNARVLLKHLKPSALH